MNPILFTVQVDTEARSGRRKKAQEPSLFQFQEGCGGCYCSSLAGENVSEHRGRGLVGYRTDRSLTGKVQSAQDPSASEQKGTIRTDSTAGWKMISNCTEP